MSVKGFRLADGSVAKYDYSALENVITDNTLSISGVAADAETVGNEIAQLEAKSFDLDESDRLKISGLSGTTSEVTDRIETLRQYLTAEVSTRSAKDISIEEELAESRDRMAEIETGISESIDRLPEIEEDISDSKDRLTELETNLSDEIANRIAADNTEKTERREAVTLEKNERIAADNALSTRINIEKSRIDNIEALPDGSTTADAELVNIRIGYDDTVYSTAGVAVRTQISDVKSDLDAEVARAEAEEARIEALFTQPVEEAVSDWLDAHPEATTTVEDGSITPIKFATGAISVDSWSGDSSINNWTGDTLEEKLQDFLQNANSGEKLDLQGAKITITERFVKSQYTFLNNTVISNGIFEIPSSIGGWLSIGSAGGYRSPIFNNCVFICNDENTSGAIFYNSAYNFKAVGCAFYNVQILNGSYLQMCELIGCNIMNRNSYLIECNFAIGFSMTDCTFEAGNVGVFKGNGNSERESLAHGAFTNCAFEGFTDVVFRTHGISSSGFISCYVEDVPYLIYDSDEYVNAFYVYVNGGRFNNRANSNSYLIYSNITNPSLLINNVTYLRESNQFFSNFNNRKKQITSGNYLDGGLYGANNGKNEVIKTDFNFSGTSFTFATNRTPLNQQPQAFLVIIARYVKNTLLYTRVSILTLNYKASTGYLVTETPLVSNASMVDSTTWTATADDMLGLVTITGVSDIAVSLSVVNLGATMSGMIVP